MPKSKRKFYKTTYTFTVLSEEPLPDSLSLSDLDYETMDGHCSGQFGETLVEELDGETAAKALIEQGSDPEFFQLTEDGEDIDE